MGSLYIANLSELYVSPQTFDRKAGPWVADSFDTTSTQELFEKQCVLQGN